MATEIKENFTVKAGEITGTEPIIQEKDPDKPQVIK